MTTYFLTNAELRDRLSRDFFNQKLLPVPEDASVSKKIHLLVKNLFTENGRTWKGWFHGTQLNAISMQDIIHGRAKLSPFKEEIKTKLNINDAIFSDLENSTKNDLSWLEPLLTGQTFKKEQSTYEANAPISTKLFTHLKNLMQDNGRTWKGWFYGTNINAITLQDIIQKKAKLTSFADQIQPHLIQAQHKKKLDIILQNSLFYPNQAKALRFAFILALQQEIDPNIQNQALKILNAPLEKTTNTSIVDILFSFFIKPPELTWKGFIQGVHPDKITMQEILDGKAYFSFFKEAIQKQLSLTSNQIKILQNLHPELLQDELEILAIQTAKNSYNLPPIVHNFVSSLEAAVSCSATLIRLIPLIAAIKTPSHLQETLRVAHQAFLATVLSSQLQKQLEKAYPILLLSLVYPAYKIFDFFDRKHIIPLLLLFYSYIYLKKQNH